MIELSTERIEQILYKETPKTDVLPTILRSIYVRYLSLYEKYFADIEALDDDVIADLKKYHEETRSLVKYYYMDIPQDVCGELETFDETYNAKLLGPDWNQILFDAYKEYGAEYKNRNKSRERLKADFSEACLKAFYDLMEEVFRPGFGTGSKKAENFVSGLSSLLFGGKKE